MRPPEPLDRWWSGLDEAGRRDALDLAPNEHLPETTALELMLCGVHVPAATVGWDLDGLAATITVYVQPRSLTDFLDAHRCPARAGR